MSQGTVITQTVLTSGSAMVALLVKGVPTTKPGTSSVGPYARIIVGAFGMGLLLTAIAAGSPDIASAFGWVIAITALLINGEAIAKATTNALKG